LQFGVADGQVPGSVDGSARPGLGVFLAANDPLSFLPFQLWFLRVLMEDCVQGGMLTPPAAAADDGGREGFALHLLENLLYLRN
jgi:hypothetical protein